MEMKIEILNRSNSEVIPTCLESDFTDSGVTSFPRMTDEKNSNGIKVIPACPESDFKDSGLSRQSGISRMTRDSVAMKKINSQPKADKLQA